MHNELINELSENKISVEIKYLTARSYLDIVNGLEYNLPIYSNVK